MLKWIILGVLLVVLVFYVLPMLLMSFILYRVLLVRTKPEKWGRECSIPDDEEYRRMFDEGLAWNERCKDVKNAVSVVSDGFHLYGEYFDFGRDKAVIIIPGRMESCLYSYYFAEPYRVAGYNVLVIDNRSHGLSEGRVTSLGFKEYRDILTWSRLLHEKLGNASVILHGVCIGSSCALFALTSPQCPDYLTAMTAEGMYPTFCESFRNHMLLDHRPIFPFLYLTMAYIRILSGANVVTDGPIRRISLLQKPILFLHSREDVFSRPDKAQQLYNKCTAPKTLVWFDKGAHSRIRINNEAAYDRAIVDFCATIERESKNA